MWPKSLRDSELFFSRLFSGGAFSLWAVACPMNNDEKKKLMLWCDAGVSILFYFILFFFLFRFSVV